MARVSRRTQISNRNNHIISEQIEQQAIYDAGIYVRLSVLNSGIGDDCESLENQEALLREYLAAQTDIRFVDIYVDNGETGTNFERPGFNRMMDDVKSGRINCIIVKDLSRFGRNYIETGEYVEKIFPFLGVRLIAVCDAFDTNDPNCDGTVFSLKNIVNEAYARDISGKIHAAFEAKRENGELNVKNAPYGYMLSGDPKHPYMVDDEAAENVRMIFRMKLEGISTNEIVKRMEAAGHLTPLRYLKAKGVIKKCRDNSHWDMTAINRILTNPVYLGHMVQGKTVVNFCDNIPKTVLPPDKWIIIPNVNPPIVDQGTYDKIQECIARQKAEHKARCGKYDYLKTEAVLPGIVYCGCCGKPMIRYKKVVNPQRCIYYYLCPVYRMHREKACPNKQSIREDKLLAIVWEHIAREFDRLDNMEARIEKIMLSPTYHSSLSELEKSIEKTVRRLKKQKALLLSAFESNGMGEVSDEDYAYIRNRYETQIEEDNERLALLYEQKEKIEQTPVQNKWVTELKQFRENKQFTKEMVAALLERIEIERDNRVTIVLKYESEYETLLADTEKMEGEYIDYAG